MSECKGGNCQHTFEPIEEGEFQKAAREFLIGNWPSLAGRDISPLEIREVPWQKLETTWGCTIDNLRIFWDRALELAKDAVKVPGPGSSCDVCITGTCDEIDKLKA